jgi:lipopolysaccharide/colanic/teichoic acid biosynthesis glycosyltransferase
MSDAATLAAVAHLGAASTAQPALAPAAHAWHPPAADNDAGADRVMYRAEFLRTVQREKRRAERSMGSLSMVVLENTDVRSGDVRSVDSLLRGVCDVMRETDYLANIDDEAVAVLLPDTGAPGLARFLDKVALIGGAQASAVGATYPDPAFDRLAADRLGTPRSRHSAAEIEAPSPGRGGYFLKRSLDIVGALFAIALLSPLMLLVVLGIRLTSKGPAVFKQARIGQGGKPFVMYKFRSMRIDMDDGIHREFVASLIEGKTVPAAAGAPANFKIKADPRVTRIGRLIRKTSIDELPQFFNVLKGEMSLVGPRPPVPYEADKYKTWHRRRVFELKPGLTGIWQVEGRSRVTFDDMVRMDLRYLRECSLGFDLMILLRTVKVVLTCDGAQ